MKKLIGILAVAALLSACKPADHLIACSDYEDASGSWQLLTLKKDNAGYIMGCVWQNKDTREVRSRMCTADAGC
ncbi:hypothetical protein [Rhizobium sp. RAF56]|uniref:hypothetical protein n=1 Tax=Rhizobium sp. RAF56 TaxID=3233062 RepID=UPI003F9B76BA